MPSTSSDVTLTHAGHSDRSAAEISAPLKDPVCGMKVTTQSVHHHQHDGQDYYFCGARCLAKFSADPAQFLAPKLVDEPAAPTPAGTMYTCPMHPEVRRDHPGDCPKCGMALEPELPSLVPVRFVP